ncbi:MAG TPA: HD domain-containing protein [Polyangiales bacterium]
MILRDPVHGLVSFEGERERVIKRLLATREVQRLRRIRQLGLASQVFPGAEHSRFAHALGTAHVMSKLLDRIAVVEHAIPPDQRLDAEACRDALAAALLHDLGHGPFSHLFEEVFADAPRHEHWTCALILDATSEVYAALEELGQGTAQRVAALVRGEHRLAYLGHAVSGALDVDRCDYLLRDSHMTGVRYGIFDLEWLLRALSFSEIEEADGRRCSVLAVEGRKGLPPIEGFFLARNFMYQQVYHHKAVRAAEVLVRAIFARCTELLRDGHQLGAHLPEAFVSVARAERPALSDYVELDDASLTAAVATLRHARDPILRDLCERLLTRTLPKTIPLSELPEAEPTWHLAHQRAAEIATRRGFRPDLYVWLDVPSDVPYAEPDAPRTSALWVARRHRPLARLGEVSFLLRELRNKRALRPRLIFPAELRSEISAAIESLP